MTETMRASVEKAIERSNGNLTVEYAKSMIEQKERTISYYNSLPSWKQGYSTQYSINLAKDEIEYFEAVTEVLIEKAAAVAVAETVEVLAAIVTVANKAKAARRAVATLANKLRKVGFTLSDAFRKAWTLIKAFNELLPGAV
ncbi:MAG: hypothetical protein ACRDBO_17680 [Lachnospiraceae bacterium]